MGIKGNLIGFSCGGSGWFCGEIYTDISWGRNIAIKLNDPSKTTNRNRIIEGEISEFYFVICS